MPDAAQGMDFQKTLTVFSFIPEMKSPLSQYWVMSASSPLEAPTRKRCQEFFHAQAETADFSFLCALHLALKTEWSVNHNSYLPFLEVSVHYLNHI